MKKFVNSVFRKLGYEVRRVGNVNSIQQLRSFSPYVKEYSVQGESFKFWVSNKDAIWWYDPRVLESGENRELVQFAKNSQNILEIGSHHGFSSLLMSKFLQNDGSIVGVDAVSKNVMICQAQLTLNQCTKNLKFMNYACSDSSGEKLIIRNMHNTSVISEDSSDSIEVESITIDKLQELYGPFDMLKVDVEGHEYEVLKGAAQTLKTLPRIALELHIDLLNRRQVSYLDVLKMIDLEKYTGKMQILENWKELIDFNIQSLPSEGIVNILLEPK